MTSQETSTEVMEALKAEAKELGVAGWQVTKDPEKLQAKIDEAKKGAVRKKAPKMSVNVGEGNHRNETIKALEAKDPDCKYLTQNAKLTPAEAEAKGFEIVKQNNGDLMYCGSDIIVRTDKESYYEWHDNRTERSLNSMKSIDKDLSTEGGGQLIQSATERVKKGIDPS